MVRITVILVVLTMTSFPAASAACVAWCGAQTATTGPCHDGDSPQIARVQGRCAALELHPFVREDLRVTLDAAPGIPILETLAVPAATDRTLRRAIRVVRSRSATPPLVLRL
jgi:hypothetical protein